MDIRSVYTVKTADGLPMEIELAGVGNRIFAMVIDLCMMAVLMLFVVLIAMNLHALNSDLSQTVFYLLTFLLFFGYHFFQEWLWKGQSLGKFLLNIRVVRHNGQPIGIWEAFGRNVFRIVDVWMGGIGLLPLMFLRHEKRFGDFLASTLVINNQKVANPLGNPNESLYIKRPDQGNPDLLQFGQRITPAEYTLLQGYLNRRDHLFSDADQTLETDFRIYFQHRFQLPDEWAKAPTLLIDLYFGYQDMPHPQQPTNSPVG